MLELKTLIIQPIAQCYNSELFWLLKASEVAVLISPCSVVVGYHHTKQQSNPDMHEFYLHNSENLRSHI
jgi:hypothetical protein